MFLGLADVLGLYQIASVVSPNCYVAVGLILLIAVEVKVVSLYFAVRVEPVCVDFEVTPV